MGDSLFVNYGGGYGGYGYSEGGACAAAPNYSTPVSHDQPGTSRQPLPGQWQPCGSGHTHLNHTQALPPSLRNQGAELASISYCEPGASIKASVDRLKELIFLYQTLEPPAVTNYQFLKLVNYIREIKKKDLVENEQNQNQPYQNHSNALSEIPQELDNRKHQYSNASVVSFNSSSVPKEQNKCNGSCRLNSSLTSKNKSFIPFPTFSSSEGGSDAKIASHSSVLHQKSIHNESKTTDSKERNLYGTVSVVSVSYCPQSENSEFSDDEKQPLQSAKVLKPDKKTKVKAPAKERKTKEKESKKEPNITVKGQIKEKEPNVAVKGQRKKKEPNKAVKGQIKKKTLDENTEKPQKRKVVKSVSESGSEGLQGWFGDFDKSLNSSAIIKSPNAALNSAVKMVENMAGRVTPPTPMLKCYICSKGNTSKSIEESKFSVYKTKNNNHVRKRITGNKNQKRCEPILEESYAEKEASTKIKQVLASANSRRARTPTIVKDIFRQKVHGSDSENSEKLDSSGSESD